MTRGVVRGMILERGGYSAKDPSKPPEALRTSGDFTGEFALKLKENNFKIVRLDINVNIFLHVISDFLMRLEQESDTETENTVSISFLQIYQDRL